MLMIVPILKLNFVKRIKYTMNWFIMYSILFCKRLASFPQLCPFLKKRARELGYQFFIRAILRNDKKSLLMYKFIKHNINSSLEIALSNIHQDVHVLLNWRMSIRCNKVDFPCCCFVCLFITSFHSLSTAASASGINIAWGERSFAHTLGFPKQTSLRDRSPELSEPFVTLGSFVCTHKIRWAEQYPKLILLSSTVHTWEYLVLPKFSGLLEEFCPTDTPCRETRQHALVFALKKIKWRAFIRSFHRKEFVYQSCNIIQNSVMHLQYQYNWIFLYFRHFGSCRFGTTVSRMHVREHGLLHGIAVSR